MWRNTKPPRIKSALERFTDGSTSKISNTQNFAEQFRVVLFSAERLNIFLRVIRYRQTMTRAKCQGPRWMSHPSHQRWREKRSTEKNFI